RGGLHLTGGVGVFLGVALPMLAGLLIAQTGAADALAERLPALAVHLPGVRSVLAPAGALLACLTALHILGLIDDRRPLGPWLKLAIMLGVSAAAILLTGTRLLTALDPHVGGPWLSILVTVLWFGVERRRIYAASHYESKSHCEKMMVDKFLERNNLFNDQIMNTVNQLGLANVDVENALNVDDLTSICLSAFKKKNSQTPTHAVE
ncbi:MAG: hypothetical protein F6K28_42670, partial [Microcoleus sp. SIO2G3]|nr:hypothetical protein [Microcoleus sp. SIO2G3]